MPTHNPLVRNPFGKPPVFKLANARQVVLPGDKMSEAHNLEIRAISGMVMFSAC